eukprot:TRINITY_DN44868_c0_g1_i1.p1 TRINITY_DN44868_c0_g1~~TRINITY_DN44868_c0_g1_i1.p1  ORF type:complete len:251 (-),score=41.23 TRINITY_DN44868_c0_g1_i1:270-1022(-)
MSDERVYLTYKPGRRHTDVSNVDIVKSQGWASRHDQIDRFLRSLSSEEFSALGQTSRFSSRSGAPPSPTTREGFGRTTTDISFMFDPAASRRFLTATGGSSASRPGSCSSSQKSGGSKGASCGFESPSHGFGRRTTDVSFVFEPDAATRFVSSRTASFSGSILRDSSEGFDSPAACVGRTGRLSGSSPKKAHQKFSAATTKQALSYCPERLTRPRSAASLRSSRRGSSSASSTASTVVPPSLGVRSPGGC